MILYDMNTALNPRRVRIFLAEKGITVPMQQVDGLNRENLSPAFLKLNSLGKTPVLELDDGTLLTESIAICRYFEALHPERPLFGSTPLEIAKIEMWMRRMEFEIVAPIVTAFQHTGQYWVGRIPQEPLCGEHARNRAYDSFAWLDRELAGREFIAGDQYSIADIVAQCGFLVGKVTGTKIPSELKELTRWYTSVVARPTARA